jgi:hypothetical protein
MIAVLGKPKETSDNMSGETPGTLIDGARMYAAAADAVNRELPNSFHVISHLLGTSIELSLKAYLLNKGSSHKVIRSIGHDLADLFRECVKHGLSYTGRRNFVLTVMSKVYKDRVFAYPKPAMINSISPWRLRQVAHELIVFCFIEIKGQAVFDELSGKPGLCISSEYPKDIEPSAWATAPALRRDGDDLP